MVWAHYLNAFRVVNHPLSRKSLTGDRRGRILRCVSDASAIHPLAAELNRVLEPTAIGRSLSGLGRRLYFPKGVVAQSAEAAEHADRFNATVGLAASGGEPMHLSAIAERLPGLTAEEAFAYAPTAGFPALRDRWAEELRTKNPSLRSAVSRPVVTAGLTAGIGLASDLFVDAGDPVLLPDLVWGNYRLIMGERRGARVEGYPFFAGDRMDLDAVQSTLARHQAGAKVVAMFNFPHNPTGYSPSRAEAERLTAILAAAAGRGVQLVVLIDDAYHGLFYEEETLKEVAVRPPRGPASEPAGDQDRRTDEGRVRLGLPDRLRHRRRRRPGRRALPGVRAEGDGGHPLHGVQRQPDGAAPGAGRPGPPRARTAA